MPNESRKYLSRKFRFKPNCHQRYRRVLLTLCIGIGGLTGAGCQCLHPFAQKTRDGIVSASQWANGGLEAIQKGRLEQAKGFFSRATQQNPEDFRVRAQLAKTLFRSGDTQSAINQMQQAVSLSNNDPRMLTELGEMYLDSGQALAAQRQTEIALSSNHRYAPAWLLNGKIEKSNGEYENALSNFQKALGYSSDSLESQLEIVDTYQKMGQPYRALSAAEQLLSKHAADDQPEQAVLAKGIALIELNQLNPAIEFLETASLKKEANAEIFIRLGQAHLLAGQVSQARLTLNRGKQAFPGLVVFDQLVNELQPTRERVAALETTTIR